MKSDGICDFCGRYEDWEVGIWNDPETVKSRPATWAAFFPAKAIPTEWKNKAWFAPEFCVKHNIDVKLTCPDCCR